MSLPQGPFPFGALMGQDMVRMGFGKDKFAASRLPEPLRCSPVGFYFRHRLRSPVLLYLC